MSHWAGKKIVVRDFYISFKPLGSGDSGRGLDLSVPLTNQASDEAVYIAVTGRPAGLVNFIREHIGLSRRFEFLMTSSQCIQRLGSPSTQILSSSRLEGLNTITVGLVRPLRAALTWGAAAILLLLATSHIISPTPSLPTHETTAAAVDTAADAVSEVSDSEQSSTDEAAAATELEEPPSSGSIWNKIGIFLGIVDLLLTQIAPNWVWNLLALAIGIFASYLFFIAKRNVVTVSESGEAVVGFVVSPSLLESKSTDIPLEELNRIPLIFRVLKSQ